MALQLFLNDLSAVNAQVPHAQSVAWLRGLVEIVRAAREVDGELVLNCAQPLNALALGQDTTVVSLRNDGECVEEGQFLKALANRAPFSHAAEEAEAPDPNGFEYRIPAAAPAFAGMEAHGLGLAHRLKGLGVSLPSAELWRSRLIALDLLELDEQGELQTRQVQARNACCAQDTAAHADSLREDLRPAFQTGAELWARRADIFPYLEFIPRTRGQIEGIPAGDARLEPVWRKLSGIDRAIATWSRLQSAYPSFPFNVRPESHTREKLAKFNDAQGFERTFSDHTDLAPIAGRIHFIILSEPRRHALIGHVGRKLGIG